LLLGSIEALGKSGHDRLHAVHDRVVSILRERGRLSIEEIHNIDDLDYKRHSFRTILGHISTHLAGCRIGIVEKAEDNRTNLWDVID